MPKDRKDLTKVFDKLMLELTKLDYIKNEQNKIHPLDFAATTRRLEHNDYIIEFILFQVNKALVPV